MVAQADIRIATWNIDMARKGPGLLLGQLSAPGDPRAAAAVTVLTALDADVILLTKFDFDARGAALAALRGRLAAAGLDYPYAFARAPNSGVATGLDLDGDGQAGGPGDAQGWGVFAGQKGMAILSKLPILEDEAQDYSAFLWADLPGNLMPPDTPAAVRGIQRLSSTGHWAVPVALPGGGRLMLLAWYATPPAFDGAADRNRRRNHDEAAFWLRLLAGDLPFPPPAAPFVLLGQGNCDPDRGACRADALRALLASPLLQDPRPGPDPPAAGAAQPGDRPQATALYGGKAGALRVDLVLPSAGLRVTGAGVLTPDPALPLAAALKAVSQHRPVWVDLAP